MNCSVSAIEPVQSVPAIAYELARMTLQVRGRRSEHFDETLFGEPAWDALLLLFLERPSSEAKSAAVLAERIGIAQSTMERWLAILESGSLVERVTSDDREPVFAITTSGRRSMIDLFSI